MNVTRHVRGAQSAVSGKHLLWMAILSIVADRAVTLLWWGYEANPVVVELGMGPWLGLSVLLVVMLTLVYRSMKGTGWMLFAHICLGVVIGLHTFTAVTNVMVVAGVL